MRTTHHFATLMLLMAASSPAAAQQSGSGSPDTRWTAWLGCWQQLEETTREENLVEPGTDNAVPTRGVVVCVTPASNPAGVTLSTIVEKQFALEETVVADGASRAIDEPACRGSQRAEWSKTGRRLFAHADLSCDDGTKRTVSGLTTIAPGPVWVDIQVVNSGGRESIRVRRYRRSPEQSYVASRLTEEQIANAGAAAVRQARSFSLDEVKEAGAKVTPSTVEAALIETGARFPLNAKRLEELDAAGVPDRVLDLMIAMSFPNRFVVERRTASAGPTPFGGGFDPGLWWIDAGYDIFPYHYAPFAYGMWGRSDYHYYGAPVYAVDVVSSSEPRPSGDGRVVDGMGYTRVRSRDPQPANTGGFSTADSSGGGSSSGGSGSSGGGVSSQGYSGGGGDSGRTAVARPPG